MQALSCAPATLQMTKHGQAGLSDSTLRQSAVMVRAQAGGWLGAASVPPAVIWGRTNLLMQLQPHQPHHPVEPTLTQLQPNQPHQPAEPTDLRQLAVSSQLAIISLDDHPGAHQRINPLQACGWVGPVTLQPLLTMRCVCVPACQCRAGAGGSNAKGFTTLPAA